MTRTNKGIFSLCIPLLAILIIFTSCEDPGNVGSGFVDRPELVYDTLTVSNTQELDYQGYSGKLSFIPIGHYSDQLFGDISAQGLIKPTLSPSVPDSLELGENFSLQIEFLVDSLESYGDTTSLANFSIYEITSPWRGSVLRIDDEIPYGNQVGSFTIGAGQTEVFVSNLSQQWVDKYKSYYNSEDSNIDSLYNYEFGGLIIIPDQNSSKISFPRASDSRFLMINEAGTDTVNVPFHDWGYTLDRSATSYPTNTFPLLTTLEGMLSLTIPDSLKSDNSTKNIIRAELIFHEAEEDLSSGLGMGHVRLPVESLSLNLVEVSDPEYQYQFGNPEFISTSQEEEASYKINITNYVNNIIYGNETRKELILGIGSSSGALRSTLLYNETAPKQLQPKLIITSLVD